MGQHSDVRKQGKLTFQVKDPSVCSTQSIAGYTNKMVTILHVGRSRLCCQQTVLEGKEYRRPNLSASNTASCPRNTYVTFKGYSGINKHALPLPAVWMCAALKPAASQGTCICTQQCTCQGTCQQWYKNIAYTSKNSPASPISFAEMLHWDLQRPMGVR